MSQRVKRGLGLGSLAVLAVLSFAIASVIVSRMTLAAPPKPKMSTPSISCGTSTPSSIDIGFCAGATGAPAGFSIQWTTCAEFAQYGWPADSDNPFPRTTFCKASFSGVPGASQYNVPANNCVVPPGSGPVVVNIGDNLFDTVGASSTCPNTPLSCNTCYVFRSFAHANSTLMRSDFSATIQCTTGPCGGEGCTYTQGYWKTHGPEGCLTGMNANVWPPAVLAGGMDLGNVHYTADELCSIFNTPAQGNGLISLAHQLIAANLNVANGADPTDANACIGLANALIGNLVVPPVGSDSLPTSDTSELTTCLDNYNMGVTGPGHCP